MRDKLLDKIEAVDYWQEHFANKTFMKALLAVVELHKPDEYDGKTCVAHEQCWGCEEWGSSEGCDCNVYPCETIQAIEKALQ